MLVTGATGGVGRIAVQLAHLAGAQVTAWCATRPPKRGGAAWVPPVLPPLNSAATRTHNGGRRRADVRAGDRAPGPRGVLVNIATQDDAETVTFRAKNFDRAHGARIYTLNLPSELTLQASGFSEVVAGAPLAAGGHLDLQVELECSWGQPAQAVKGGRRIGGKAVLHSTDRGPAGPPGEATARRRISLAIAPFAATRARFAT